MSFVWQDDRQAVALKPAGRSSEGAPDAVLEEARRALAWPEARLPHRLDRLTRGYLVIARDAASAAAHGEAIRARRWVKAYLARLAVPEGLDPRTLVGPHKAYLRREGTRSTVVRSGGDPSFLDLLAIAPAPRNPGHWHAAIRLHTGRFHQIRVMCAHLGCPLAGDDLYCSGTGGPPTLEHAVLSFPVGAGADQRRVTLWRRDDPEREPVDQSVLDALASVAESAIATT